MSLRITFLVFNLNCRCRLFFFFFFSLFEFLFKPWFRPKSFSSAKVAYIHQRATFLFRMSLINATRKYSIYCFLGEVQCLNI